MFMFPLKNLARKGLKLDYKQDGLYSKKSNNIVTVLAIARGGT